MFPKQAWGPGGVARGLDLGNGPKSVRGNWPLWSPVVSMGLPSPPTAAHHHLPPPTYHHQPPPMINSI